MGAGLTYRQVHHWTRMGWLVPEEQRPGPGVRLLYPPSEVEVAARMLRLVRAGLVPVAAHRAVREGGCLAEGVWVEMIPVPTVVLNATQGCA